MNDINISDLIKAAARARKYSYSPYSHYAVGAAVFGGDGRVFSGCNIENASYGGTVCAERTAIFKAVSEGCGRIRAIAIVGGPAGKMPESEEPLAYPCGICRQVMREFSDPWEMQVIIARSEEDFEVRTLEELLPESFGPQNLNGCEQ